MRWRFAVPLIVAAAVLGCSRDRDVPEQTTAEISDTLETGQDSTVATAGADPHAVHSNAPAQATETAADHEQHVASPVSPAAAGAPEHADHAVPPTSTAAGQVAAATSDPAHAAHAEPQSTGGGAAPLDTAHVMHQMGAATGAAAPSVPADTAHAAHAGEPTPAGAMEQHVHPGPEAPAQPMAMDHEMAMQDGAMGPMLGVLGIPMDRMGSGTTWIPDAVTLPSRHWMTGSWDVMLHGFGFLQYNHQGGPRGDAQLGSLNWAMLMAGRPVGAGMIQFRAMLSLDAATVTARGYPLLLQTGEVFEGEPISDRQHPHDFWMELGALYERPLGPIGLSIYAAPSGEPALGPVAFMHRPSAMDDPVAPLAHHWLDATHISFGVVTLGVFQERWKVEGSLFNGREPDEHRWDFDPDRLDSYSGRVTLNPNASWSMAFGLGRLESPETMHPTEDVRRITASILYGRPLANGQWASTLAWGANTHIGEETTMHGAVLESEAVLDDRHTLFGRIDFAQKTAGELGLEEADGFDHDQGFNVGALSVGFIRELGGALGMTGGLGIRGTVSLVPEELRRSYGSRTPLAGLLFFRVRPARQASMAESMR